MPESCKYDWIYVKKEIDQRNLNDGRSESILQPLYAKMFEFLRHNDGKKLDDTKEKSVYISSSFLLLRACTIC